MTMVGSKPTKWWKYSVKYKEKPTTMIWTIGLSISQILKYGRVSSHNGSNIIIERRWWVLKERIDGLESITIVENKISQMVKIKNATLKEKPMMMTWNLEVWVFLKS